MKKFLLVSLIVFFTACTNATPTPTIQTFTETVAVATLNPATETPTATETETAIPETAEQKAARELTEAVAAGLRTNNPDTWTGQYATYAQWYKNASNPDIVSDAQLNELNMFMQNGRKADQLRYFSENPDNAKIILTDFLVQFVPGSITREAAANMSVADLENLAYSQNEYLRQFLELRYHALTGEETLFAPKEIKDNETNPKSCPLFHRTGEPGNPVWNGFYGMWVNNAPTFLKNAESLTNDEIVFHHDMFGRQTERCGFLAGDDIAADFMGYGKKSGSDGIYYTHWLVKDAKGVPFLHTYLVVTDPNYAISIPTGSHVLGSFNGLDTVDSGSIHRDISLTTGFAYINGNNRQQLTLDILKQFHTWPPGIVKIESGSISMPGGGNANQFFDPETGLMIIGSEVGASFNGFLYFGTDVNPWP